MYFCPNCSYILDITKSVSTTTSDKIPILKINDIFKLLENNENLIKYTPEFTKTELEKNKKYQKLSNTDKAIIDVIFETNLMSDAEFKCDNCNYSKKILDTTLLYQINIDEKINKIFTLEENELITKDPLLPHTHDYICKNPKCTTHDNTTIKDAVFYKTKNNYKINYICCICYYNW